jgi:hypothetical protein
MGSLARLARISTLAGSATLMSMEATVFYSRNDGPASESQKVLLTFGYLTENCACDLCIFFFLSYMLVPWLLLVDLGEEAYCIFILLLMLTYSSCFTPFCRTANIWSQSLQQPKNVQNVMRRRSQSLLSQQHALQRWLHNSMVSISTRP